MPDKNQIFHQIPFNFAIRKYQKLITFNHPHGEYFNCQLLEKINADDLPVKLEGKFYYRSSSVNNHYILYSKVKIEELEEEYFDSALAGEGDWGDGTTDIDDHFKTSIKVIKTTFLKILRTDTNKYLRVIQFEHYPIISAEFSEDEKRLYVSFLNGIVYVIELAEWSKLDEVRKENMEDDDFDFEELIYEKSIQKIISKSECDVIFSPKAKYFYCQIGLFNTDQIANILSQINVENHFSNYFKIFKNNVKIEFYEEYSDESDEVYKDKHRLLLQLLITQFDTTNEAIRVYSELHFDRIKATYFDGTHLFIKRIDNKVIKIPKFIGNIKLITSDDLYYSYPKLFNEFVIFEQLSFSFDNKFLIINDYRKRNLLLYCLDNEELLGEFSYTESDINCLLILLDNSAIFAGDDDGCIYKFEIDKFSLTKKFRVSFSPISFICENQDESLTIFTRTNAIKIMNV